MDQVTRLCDRAKSGDVEAASELVNIFYEKLFSYFRRLCGNDQDAEDFDAKDFSEGLVRPEFVSSAFNLFHLDSWSGA